MHYSVFVSTEFCLQFFFHPVTLRSFRSILQLAFGLADSDALLSAWFLCSFVWVERPKPLHKIPQTLAITRNCGSWLFIPIRSLLLWSVVKQCKDLPSCPTTVSFSSLWREVASPQRHHQRMASSCISGGLDWILGKISLLKEWSRIETGCPGQWWSHHPWRCSNNV